MNGDPEVCRMRWAALKQMLPAPPSRTELEAEDHD